MNAFESYLRCECGRADGTVREYLKDIAKLDAWMASYGATLANAPAAKVREYVRELSRAGRAASTIIRRLGTVATYWRFLGRGADLDALERPRLPRTIPDLPNAAEVARMIDSATDLRDRAIMEVLYGSGLRREELTKLTVADMQAVHLLVHGKGGKDRLVPTSGASRDAIGAYLFTRGQTAPTDPLFTEAGHAMLPGHIFKLIVRYAKRSKQRCKISPHTLRHCFATHMLTTARCNPVDIMGMLGHSNLETTARYLHMQIGDIKRMHQRCHPRERQARGEPMKAPAGIAA